MSWARVINSSMPPVVPVTGTDMSWASGPSAVACIIDREAETDLREGLHRLEA